MSKTVLALMVMAMACAAPRAVGGPVGQGEGKAEALRTFYFGNSLTGCTNPQWHEELGRSVGAEWIAEAFLGAGWPLWKHRQELGTHEIAFSTDAMGDLTIAPEFVQAAPYKARKFYEGQWDAIVLQAFGPSLDWKVTQMWDGKVKFDQVTDVGDIQSATDIIALYLKIEPKGNVYIYAVWPPMEAGEVPPEDQLPDWAKGRDGPRTAEFPNRAAFDYEREWLGKQYSPDNPDRPWLDNKRCQDYHNQLFEALRKNFPRLWQEGRLRMIPTGDIFCALDRKMRAGHVPGIRTIADFYTDVQHIRAGLPRYTAAAAFYACLFGEHPGKLDWRIYNDPGKYGDDPHHDKGILLEITPERARIVNDTIWEVVTNHPYTGLGQP